MWRDIPCSNESLSLKHKIQSGYIYFNNFFPRNTLPEKFNLHAWHLPDLVCENHEVWWGRNKCLKFYILNMINKEKSSKSSSQLQELFNEKCLDICRSLLNRMYCFEFVNVIVLTPRKEQLFHNWLFSQSNAEKKIKKKFLSCHYT
jgi:hypothetical protein